MKKLIKYPFQKLRDFFLWASGADLEILKQAPTDANKYFGIGGTIIFTALMASFAGGYAIFITFNSALVAVFFGLFWGALIFNLDRYIVSTFGVGDGKKTISKQELLEGAPRLLMAVVLGFVIATPLELKLFEDSINEQIGQNVRVERQNLKNEASAKNDPLIVNWVAKIAKLEKDNNNYQKVIDSKLNTYNLADKDQQDEWNTGKFSGKPGKGELWDELKAKADRALADYQKYESEYTTKISDNNKSIHLLNEQINKQTKQNLEASELSKRVIEQNTGLLVRLEALSQITSRSSTLLFAKWLITILFIFIEISPILFKMMTERGTYDDILDRIKHEAKVKQLLLQSNINEEINTAVKVHANKNEQKLNAELVANKDLLLSISKAQAEIAQVAIEEWKKEQLEKVKNDPSNMIKS
ncbi:DUF4407 domain-containing protein [Brumimicrobium aurantiacum]|uniref:DUF4407 domain-containing protein n=1 Tax=Brumimicrobium aurantiacum TaxID=1737063 RepID=A0A3E1EWY1_9FLAO|nr:DUF4407 domain-containing protein [Brumimicrobium aurantiacum]RFC54057.1 DUF4407 domain-containing protein [Brumimicrobium aurantiacum]